MATTETTTTRLSKAQVIDTIVSELRDARTALSAQNRTRRGYWTGRCDALAALLAKLCPEHPALDRPNRYHTHADTRGEHDRPPAAAEHRGPRATAQDRGAAQARCRDAKSATAQKGRQVTARRKQQPPPPPDLAAQDRAVEACASDNRSSQAQASPLA